MKQRILMRTLVLAILMYSTSAEVTECEGSHQCPFLSDCTNGICTQKDLFPLTLSEAFGSVLIILISGLANVAGLGGGSILSPILIACFDYNPNKAIMIIYALLFGGSFGSFLRVVKQKDPKTGKGYVDYDLSLVCIPLLLLGTSIGVVLNNVLPPILVILGLIGIMTYTIKGVYATAKVHRSREMIEAQESLLISKACEKNAFEMTAFRRKSRTITDPSYDPKVLEIMKEENDSLPRLKLQRCAALVAWVIIMGTADHFHSYLGFEYCHIGYWVIYFLTLVGCVCFYISNRKFLLGRLELRKLYGIITDQEYDHTNELTKYIPRLAAVAGLMAGLLGVGGGMIFGPALLSYGFSPQALGATSGFFVAQSSLTASFFSLLHGDISMGEVTFFLTISFIGTYGVSTLLAKIKPNRSPSFLLYSFAIVLALSTAVLPIFALWKSYTRPEEMLYFNSLCK